MNWLIHIFLSEKNTDFQIGNFIADPLKCKPWEDASTNIKNGMEIHKFIDSFSDSHPIIKTSKDRLKSGLLKAVVIDLCFDYLLSKNWQKFSNQPLQDFTQEFYTQALEKKYQIPEDIFWHIQNLVNRDLLNKYQTLEDLKHSFERMDRRLSPRLKKRDTCINYLESVLENIDLLEKDFLEFFPILMEESKKLMNKDKLHHWID
jgi:acyl carrier protein phosphodiesterase